MKIAVPSDDRATVAAQFGRSRGFLIYETDGKLLEAAGYRSTSLEAEGCECSSAERPSRHQAMLDALEGCAVVIARGMGAHMYDDLVAWGVEVHLTDVGDAPAAAALYVAQMLPERADLGCEHDDLQVR
jgi:predicted Fe-Mo cluster-binding NifX family protein